MRITYGNWCIRRSFCTKKVFSLLKIPLILLITANYFRWIFRFITRRIFFTESATYCKEYHEIWGQFFLNFVNYSPSYSIRSFFVNFHFRHRKVSFSTKRQSIKRFKDWPRWRWFISITNCIWENRFTKNPLTYDSLHSPWFYQFSYSSWKALFRDRAINFYKEHCEIRVI